MGRRYKQISVDERSEIAWRREAGQTYRQIAAALDRSASSIAREVARNSMARGQY